MATVEGQGEGHHKVSGIARKAVSHTEKEVSYSRVFTSVFIKGEKVTTPPEGEGITLRGKEEKNMREGAIVITGVSLLVPVVTCVEVRGVGTSP